MNLLSRIKQRLLSPVAIRVASLNDSVWHDSPFGRQPRLSRDGYLKLWQHASDRSFPEIDGFEQELGYRLPKSWLDDLALQTQVVVKSTPLNYQHGRVLYAALRSWLAAQGGSLDVTILETGTARGFSAICMARALMDAGVSGRILTMDVLPHDTAFLWNCISDLDGPVSRRELLSEYERFLQSIIFLQGDTKSQISRLGLPRVPFAFLDAQHTYQDVMAEAAVVIARQKLGDMIVFDDVTEGVFPGVCEAVREIASKYGYSARFLQSGVDRGYALLTRIC